MKRLWIPLTAMMLSQPTSLDAAERVALVIGNGQYLHGNKLSNPPKDAASIKLALDSLQFETNLLIDASWEDMDRAVMKFGRDATNAKIAWLFFAGHGVEVEGINYLVPVNARPNDAEEVKYRTLPLGLVLDKLKIANTPLKIVTLDCCRNNPLGEGFKGYTRDGGGGLGVVGNTPAGTLISYAAAPGALAEDGSGANSPYTTALIAAMNEQGVDITHIFLKTGQAVYAATKERQQPWLNTSFYGSFVFRPKPGPDQKADPIPPPQNALDQGTPGKGVNIALGEDLNVDIEVRYCPPGDFTMGSMSNEEGREPDEGPVKVQLTRGFWIGSTEVTQKQWSTVTGKDPSRFKGPNRPVEMVTWKEAMEFPDHLNKTLPLAGGWRWALPTEAQWEYACRAGSKEPFYANLNKIGWYIGNLDVKATREVGLLIPNNWNLYDTHGNVWEWCRDGYRYSIPGGTDPRADGDQMGLPYRVARGGGYADPWQTARAACRYKDKPEYKNTSIGLRLAIVKE